MNDQKHATKTQVSLRRARARLEIKKQTQTWIDDRERKTKVKWRLAQTRLEMEEHT